MDTEPSPMIILENIFHSWWILVVFALLGGAAGYLFHLIQPPIYEARAEISVNIDFTRTGKLTDVEQDQAIVMVRDILFSDDVIDQVVAETGKVGIILQKDQISDTFSMDRIGFRWAMRTRHSDSNTAVQLADLWAKTGLNYLREASGHAFTANNFQNGLNDLQDCFQNSVAVKPLSSVCPYLNLQELQKQIQEVSQLVKNERALAKGLMPYTDFSITKNAESSARVVQFSRSILIVAGGGLGLIAGMLIVLLRSRKLLSAGKRSV